jgi:hypothetical protein
MRQSRRTKPVRGRSPRPSRTRRPSPLVIGSIAVAIAIVAGVWYFAGRAGRTATAASGLTIGRLPAGVSQDALNVIVITLDTTRWDRLGAYGDRSAETPNLDRLAAEGVLFEQAITSVPLTLPAHSTIFTGKLPPRHGVRDNGGYVLDPKNVTLATMLRRVDATPARSSAPSCSTASGD